MIVSYFVFMAACVFAAADIVKSPSLPKTQAKHLVVKRQSERFLVDEVGEQSNPDRNPQSVLTNSDDYSDFNNKPVANRASYKLKTVTFRPILPTYSTPRPSIRNDQQQFTPSSTVPPIDPRAIRRTGFSFQHYPYDRLHRFYNLNPRLQFIYPRELENVEWEYPIERTPYYHQRQFYNLAALGYYGKR